MIYINARKYYEGIANTLNKTARFLQKKSVELEQVDPSIAQNYKNMVRLIEFEAEEAQKKADESDVFDFFEVEEDYS